MKKLVSLLVCPVLALVFIGCSGATQSSSSTIPATASYGTTMPGTPVSVTGGGTYWTITTTQLASFTIEDYLLVEANPTYIGEISSTDLFINSNNISKELDKFPADKTAKIVVYCAAGVNSKVVAATLVKAGYTKVMELDGGILAWQKQGYPTTSITRTMS
jgi:rhodanese-related sulfurtransferase